MILIAILIGCAAWAYVCAFGRSLETIMSKRHQQIRDEIREPNEFWKYMMFVEKRQRWRF